MKPASQLPLPLKQRSSSCGIVARTKKTTLSKPRLPTSQQQKRHLRQKTTPKPPDLSDFTSLRDQPIPRQEISDQALYDHLLRIEHEPNRATRKKLATKAFFALISKLDKENDQFYQSMLSDDTPCEGVDINNKPYSF
jgi:hypothetical protein